MNVLCAVQTRIKKNSNDVAFVIGITFISSCIIRTFTYQRLTMRFCVTECDEAWVSDDSL